MLYRDYISKTTEKVYLIPGYDIYETLPPD